MDVNSRYVELSKDLPVLTSSSGSSFQQHQRERNQKILAIVDQLFYDGFSREQVASVIPDLDTRLPTIKGMGLTIEEQKLIVSDYSANPLDYTTTEQKTIADQQQNSSNGVILGIILGALGIFAFFRGKK